MTEHAFKALVLREIDGKIAAEVEHLTREDLPAGDVTVSVEYSDLNYKDGMAITGQGHRRVISNFPMVAGIDLAGVVESSGSPRFAAGDRVVLTGWGVGETWWGGYAQKARVKADWLVPLPDGMTTRQAMSYGTAGFTAMLCVDALERHGIDRQREILVTGAAGGVGSVAIVLLATLGYRVVASSGRLEQRDYLMSLGANEVIDRSVLSVASAPLLTERWGGVVDCVGGQTLASALSGCAYGAAAAACGLVGSRDLLTTVLPFIMRSVTLIGVDSVYCPLVKRLEAWSRLTELLPAGLLAEVIEEISLDELPARAREVVSGQVRGRVIVKLTR
jgi:acrylyl-CoA reductase (NADPH)